MYGTLFKECTRTRFHWYRYALPSPPPLVFRDPRAPPLAHNPPCILHLTPPCSAQSHHPSMSFVGRCYWCSAWGAAYPYWAGGAPHF